MRKFLLLVFGFSSLVLAQTNFTTFGNRMLLESGARATRSVSLIAMVSDPSSWSGELVEVEGWFQAAYGIGHVYTSSEYCARRSQLNGIQVDISALFEEALGRLELPSGCIFARVQGKFSELPEGREPLPIGIGEGQPVVPQSLGKIEATHLALEASVSADD